ncbi:MAG: hypothetical protein NZ958_01895 [Bacteroidia bacterium]|nr:hypothetical protein [Bacteroidia bacterium]MDW8089095.1 hypothetical protein [Bacteroidia bacterium]
MFSLLSLWAQALCAYTQETGYVQWLLFHPLEHGHGEAVARTVVEGLFGDSVLRQVAYTHGVRYRFQRRGQWVCLEGEATPEGLFTLFHVLRGAIQRFPQRLQQNAIPIAESPPELNRGFQIAYEDTLPVDLSPLALTQYFTRYWQAGGVRGVLRGKIPTPLLHLAQEIAAGGVSELYWPPQPPPALSSPAHQGPGVVYIRWQLSGSPSLAVWAALWQQADALLHYLCAERQIACQAQWVPFMKGVELWIETGLPYATQQAAQDFLSRPFCPSPQRLPAFFTWLHRAENFLLAGWWACLWQIPQLPTAIPTLSAKELQRAARGWQLIIHTWNL